MFEKQVFSYQRLVTTTLVYLCTVRRMLHALPSIIFQSRGKNGIFNVSPFLQGCGFLAKSVCRNFYVYVFPSDYASDIAVAFILVMHVWCCTWLTKGAAAALESSHE